MPRNARVDVGDEIYHVINRSNGRHRIFNTETDYRIFEGLLLETKELVDMRILAYIIMPNHWHLVLYPKKDGNLGTFMHRLTNAHTRKVHALTKTNGSGHLYQGRYKSFLVATDNYLLSVIKYVERNAVRAKLARQCENWQWGSAYRRIQGTKEEKKLAIYLLAFSFYFFALVFLKIGGWINGDKVALNIEPNSEKEVK